ncbi:helix-turn-helix domain-containing protein [Clostridium saccharobutylicum]|uniref:HTH-type transcriptional regulator PuuR n=1 Tax=Clostridium saccharobutylicum TaxID=169679 RepID=A0A1S8MTG3_CLOSA|nr:XRE family transcriptional regulator [Clostridium saccharobutylicum]OOM07475.1 HTH-type transcriptional regulator PuuR [Clostridium saccharobutylicum]
MEDINPLIAANLKKIREEKKLSLDKLSELTGISKSMLAQIERGKSNPTITTLSKIAFGLKIQITTLITTPKANTVVMNKNDINPLEENNGKYRLYPFFPYEDGRCFELYTLEIEKGGYLSSEPHIEGTQEFLTVFQGEITIEVDNEKYKIKNGNSIRFKSDKSHSYHNSGSNLLKAHLIVYRHP